MALSTIKKRLLPPPALHDLGSEGKRKDNDTREHSWINYSVDNTNLEDTSGDNPHEADKE